jgi:hypothetical protein
MGDQTIYATLVRHQNGALLFRTERCPYCGKRHIHGAGLPGDDPRDYQGPRLAHCWRGNYFIRLAGDPEAGSGNE